MRKLFLFPQVEFLSGFLGLRRFLRFLPFLSFLLGLLPVPEEEEQPCHQNADGHEELEGAGLLDEAEGHALRRGWEEEVAAVLGAVLADPSAIVLLHPDAVPAALFGVGSSTVTV